jgi:hypothetical protein
MVLVAGCASTPDVIYKYYPPQAQSTVTVTQTIDCTSDKTALIVVSTPALNTLCESRIWRALSPILSSLSISLTTGA